MIWLDKFSDSVGRIIKWFVLYMVMATFVVVIMRYFFNDGSIALQESVMYLHAMTFMLGAAFTLRVDQHVRVDIFYQKFSPKGKAWVNMLGTVFFLLPFCVYIFWSSWEYVANSWQLKESSREAGGLPYVYLLKANILLLAVFLALQGFSEMVAAGKTIIGRNQSTDATSGIVEG